MAENLFTATWARQYLDDSGRQLAPGSMGLPPLSPAVVGMTVDNAALVGGAVGEAAFRDTPRVLILPIPVSLNDCRCVVKGRIVTTTAGKRYQQTVIATYHATYGGMPMLTGSLSGTLELFPPDRRRRDLPNLEKLLGDALQAAGAYLDDSQFDEWHFYRRGTTVPGYVRLTIQKRTQT